MNRHRRDRPFVSDLAGFGPGRSGVPWATRWPLAALCLVLNLQAATADTAPPRSPEVPPAFRVGLSPATLGHLNRNDVMAAMKVWTRALLTQRGIDLAAEVRILEDSSDLLRSLASRSVDSVSLAATEYLTLREASPDIYVTVRGGSFRETYALVVRRDTGIDKLSDLRGTHLSMVYNQRMLLATTWLETVLGRQSLGRPSEFFGAQIEVPDHSKAILSVFFRKTAACITTTNALALAAELNPQVRRDTVVLEAAPPLPPRRRVPDPGPDRVLHSLVRAPRCRPFPPLLSHGHA